MEWSGIPTGRTQLALFRQTVGWLRERSLEMVFGSVNSLFIKIRVSIPPSSGISFSGEALYSFTQVDAELFMLTTHELRETMLAAGDRLIAAQAIETDLAESPARPGILQEVRAARAAVNTLSADYLWAVRQYRQRSEEKAAALVSERLKAPAIRVASNLRWFRRRQTTARLEELCAR
jgi:hypothetical protein